VSRQHERTDRAMTVLIILSFGSDVKEPSEIEQKRIDGLGAEIGRSAAQPHEDLTGHSLTRSNAPSGDAHSFRTCESERCLSPRA
jgi:hypothetical protein